MFCHFTKIATNYKSILDQAKSSDMVVPQSSIRILIAIAIILASVALVGNMLGGYHFAFMEINSFSSLISPILLENITVFGDGVFLLALVLLFSNRQVRFHWTILFTSLLSAIVVNVLKNHFAMPRPPAELDVEIFNLIGRAYQARSFPSGHSATAFLLATVCFCYAKNTYLKMSFIILAVLVGLSRVLVGVHWPMDVLVGGALGIILGLTGVMVTSKWRFGLSAPVHLFTLGLMVMACIMIFVKGNDYTLALPMLYIVSAAALLQTIKNYILMK
tara:strand:+ start:490 stop:1314 length:825 start_codon:yes stop_codon:yes gene_type:complete